MPKANTAKPVKQTKIARAKERERQAASTAAPLAKKPGLEPLLTRAVEKTKVPPTPVKPLSPVSTAKPDEQFLSPEQLEQVRRALVLLEKQGVTLRRVAAGIDYFVRLSLQKSA